MQGVLGAALGRLLRLPDLTGDLVVAGRTDAGVHARGQVCHLDVPDGAWAALPGRSTSAPEQVIVRGLRALLPDDVRVHRVSPAPAGFDARFSAVWRRYAYRICTDPAGAAPLRRYDVLAVRGPLDVAAMNAACADLVGLNDFAAFCRKREGATTIRTLLAYSWAIEDTADGELVTATVVADAFCHSMVRALVGGALAVGSGRRGTDWLATVLAGRRRDPGVTVVPPHGLVLEQVGYPDDARLADRARQARAVRVAGEAVDGRPAWQVGMAIEDGH